MANQGTTGSIGREFPHTIEQAAQILEQGEKVVAETVDKGRHLFSQAVKSGEHAVENAYGQAKNAVESSVDSTTSMIKKYPLQSLLVGFGVGLLAGFAIKASR